MQKFRINSIIFISVIAVIFGCNVFYLVRLYESIRSDVEREVMTALADTDIDDMWERAERARQMAKANGQPLMTKEEADSVYYAEHGAISGQVDEDGNFVTSAKYDNGAVSVKREPLRRDRSYTNQMMKAMSPQMHESMDRYYGYDVFRLCFNPENRWIYRACVAPLTSHILSQMMGVIVTIFLLMVAFAAAFRYLFRTVSKLRTIEEMKDDFVGNMTHELKTPISIAYSANDALLNYDTANDPEKKEAYLTIAMKQLKRLGELVENILAMSMERRKTMTLKPEKIDLPELVEEIAEAQRMRGDKEIAIDVQSAERVAVTADKTHLANVLNNLIDNAIKYSGESVAIAIKIAPDSIEVADNGIGIPAKSLPYIFDKFYRVPHGNRQDVRGYGIGLYYVKHILEKMEWTISVKSQEGHGTVFTINFPQP